MLFSGGYTYSQCDNPDTTAPINIPPPNITTINDSGLCTAYVSDTTLSYPIVYDGCGVISTIATGIPSGYEFPVGTTTVTWTVTDVNGNVTLSYQTVTVTDEEDPQVTCPGNITVDTTPGQCGANVNVPIINATDNCAIASIINDFNSGGANASGTYPLGTTTVTYTVTDTANRTTTCSIDVTVVNTQSPEITLLGADTITLEACNTYNELGATANDVCFGDISSDIIIDTSSLDTSTIGSYFVFYNVVNSSGIAATTIIRTVNVVDTASPNLTLIGPNVLTVGACSTYTELGASAIDPCFGNISANVVINNSNVDTSTVGSYTVTYNVTDNNGNTANQITRTVTVVDNSGPDIVLLGDNPYFIEVCDSYTEPGATAVDPCFNVDYTSDIVIDSSNVDINTPGSYTVTYNVMDAVGNVAVEVIRNVVVVDTTPPVITLIGDNPQIVSACTPYIELGANAVDGCLGDYTSDIVIDTSSLNTSVEGTYQVTYDVCDSNGNCSTTITRDVEVVLSNSFADAGPDQSNTICSDTSVTLAANSIVGNSTIGIWSVTSGQTSGYSFSDPNDPNATFTGDVNETYTLTWTIDNPEPCPDVDDTITITFIGCSALDFDGIDDNIAFRDNYNLSSDFTIEIWVKEETQNSNIQTILSKREGYTLTDGYDLRIVNNYVSFNWNNGETLSSSPFQITTNQWHHIAVTHTNGTYKLYIDGIEINSISSASQIIPNSTGCLLGAMFQNSYSPYKPIYYFDGGMDEFRIWDAALTTEQIQKMMNQEISDNSGNVTGTIVPLDIAGLFWSDLNSYYQMNQSTDIVSGYLLPTNGISISGVLRNMTSLQSETAPLPYLSLNDGLWSNPNTWLHGTVQAIPNSLGIDGVTKVDWNIVRTSHNISSGNNNITLLGLDVNSNVLSVQNTNPIDGQSLRITDYLIINGNLDLVGESQLLQDIGSMYDYLGTGYLERDQKGTSNLFNYNYWSSPVSLNGINFTVASILNDGSTTTPTSINWTSSYDATGSTNPITLSDKWIYTYQDTPGVDYFDWVYKGQNATIDVGLGFTLKGSGVGDPINDFQNYTFIGKPNNGEITIPISADYQALVGNPYPSAIDANQFIIDNGPSGTNSITGALYFWEHATSNSSHVLSEYEGGYATYSLSGGVAAVSPPSEIAGLGNTNKIPQRYIPVAQGFYVTANSSNGDVVFDNNQRVFEKEVDGNSLFLRSNQTTENLILNAEPSLIKRIRLNVKSPDESIRPLLLAFTPNNEATESIDYGYDAKNTENFPNDASFIIENEKFTIQGVGNFNINNQYPLGLFLSNFGSVEITLESLENFDEAIDVFIYDSLLGTYTKINNLSYQISLEAANYNDRFYVTFSEDTTLSEIENSIDSVQISYLHNSNEIYIKTPYTINVKQVYLINVAGQTVKSWNATNLTMANDLKIPVKNISEGNYIVKVVTNTISVNKKVIIKY